MISYSPSPPPLTSLLLSQSLVTTSLHPHSLASD